MSGGAGDDTIHYTIGDGADTIDGGENEDGDTLAILGTAGDDTLDVIVTGTTITGLAGGTVTGIETVTYDALGHSTGGDTLSYTGSTDAVTVTLSGTQSATGFATIAGVENVTGGSGNDTLTGNDSANVLDGGLGSDTIDGGDGADTIVYDGTDVSIAGGDGTDTLKVVGSATIDLSAGDQSGIVDTAVVTGFENVDASGSSVAVTLTGSDGANILTGGDGDDTLTGGLGADTVSGGAGDDTIHYTIGDGADTIDGGTHEDGDTLAILGTAGDDTLDVIVTGTTITGLAGGRSPASRR